MSHNIKYFIYKENVDRRKVQADLDNYVAHEDWQEGCSGLNSPIRWIENCGVLNSYDEALEYIKSHDKGWYDSLAVRFKDCADIETPALKKARERVTAALKKRNELEYKPHFENTKSTLIGCRKCGSKISREHLKGNNCPVCGVDMRPQTVLDTLAKHQRNVDKAKDLVEKEKQKAIAKHGKTKWLVKIEYHT